MRSMTVWPLVGGVPGYPGAAESEHTERGCNAARSSIEPSQLNGCWLIRLVDPAAVACACTVAQRRHSVACTSWNWCVR